MRAGRTYTYRDCGMKRQRKEEKAGTMPAELRYETCRECGEHWNIARGQKTPRSGYICPHCEWGKATGKTK